MEKLVGLSAARSRKLYGLVYPRDAWWVKIVLAFENFTFWLRRNPFRTFAHPSKSVEDILGKNGLKRRSYHQDSGLAGGGLQPVTELDQYQIHNELSTGGPHLDGTWAGSITASGLQRAACRSLSFWSSAFSADRTGWPAGLR